MSTKKIRLDETDALIRFSGGDARKLLNAFELVCDSFGENEEIIITNETVQQEYNKIQLDTINRRTTLRYCIRFYKVQFADLIRKQRLLVGTYDRRWGRCEIYCT
uniref:hypothetical protein n=1 Tax=Weeksella virosa TaxID=1014 RepID=UPI0021AAAF75|nr:hypothetical protein [Weeksella virosa]